MHYSTAFSTFLFHIHFIALKGLCDISFGIGLHMSAHIRIRWLPLDFTPVKTHGQRAFWSYLHIWTMGSLWEFQNIMPARASARNEKSLTSQLDRYVIACPPTDTWGVDSRICSLCLSPASPKARHLGYADTGCWGETVSLAWMLCIYSTLVLCNRRCGVHWWSHVCHNSCCPTSQPCLNRLTRSSPESPSPAYRLSLA